MKIKQNFYTKFLKIYLFMTILGDFQIYPVLYPGDFLPFTLPS